MTRPNCSLTRNHSSIVQPWPPCSTAWRPPFSRAPAPPRGSARRPPRAAARRAAPPPARADQDLLDEPARARLQLALGVGELVVAAAGRGRASSSRVRSWSGGGSPALRAARARPPCFGRSARTVPAAGCGGRRSADGSSRAPASRRGRSPRCAPASASARPQVGEPGRRRARRIVRSRRSRSRSTAVGRGRAPARASRPRRAAERSGSGVTESQELGANARGASACRLTATDYKVRIGASHDARDPIAAPAAPRLIAAALSRPASCSRSSSERIFERTWQLAGHVSQLPAPGSYITAQAGTQPVLVVRGEGDALHAYRNVCRHRGSRLLAARASAARRSAAATTAGPTGSTAS